MEIPRNAKEFTTFCYVTIIGDSIAVNIDDQKEAFSRAYSCAIASVAKYAISEPKPDKNSVDIVFHSQKGKCIPIEAQLKATSNPCVKTVDNQNKPMDVLHYPLSIKNYNDLRNANTYCPRILIVLVLPGGFDSCPEKWIEQTSEKLVLMKCAYWTSLKGMGDSENKTNITIKIPMDEEHIFTPESLNNIARQIADVIVEV